MKHNAVIQSSLAIFVFASWGGALAVSAQTPPVPTLTEEPEAATCTRAPRAEQSACFFTQEPAAPGLYDAPLTSTLNCQIGLNPLEVKWVEPTTGVTSTTGLLIVLAGIAPANDCSRPFNPPNWGWADSKNLVLAQVFYRNLAFWPPYDFGKYQVIDVLRGTGRLLELYPQIDRRRLYLYGGSGGGHVGLQVLQCSRQLWSEVVIHSAITKITTPEDKSALYESDPWGGWNEDLTFPALRGSLGFPQWQRYQAERQLRCPQYHAGLDGVYSADAAPQGLPRVWMMHGTADPTVDVQHFLDYRQQLEHFAGQSAQSVSSTQWQLGNWNFVAIQGGDHSYAGAAADENTRAKATDKYAPEAFRRVRGDMPSLALSYSFPKSGAWTYSIGGQELGSVSLSVEELPTRAQAWQEYR